MTITTPADEPILNTNTPLRSQIPPERREQLLDEFEHSGLSRAKFAAAAGLKYATFAAWVARRRQPRGTGQAPGNRAPRVHWLEAVLREAGPPASGGAAPLRVHVAAGVWLEIRERDHVRLAAALVQALQEPTAPC
jgi:hypothetical protein